jgi:hypothetical protein
MEIPNSKQQQLTFDKGITNVPSDAICSDNTLAECIGLTYDNGEHRVIQRPEEFITFTGDDSLTILFAHKFVNEVRFIGYTKNNNVYHVRWGTRDEYNHHFLFNTEDLMSLFNIDDLQITSVGKTLIVSSGEDLSYFLWKPDGYTDLGKKIPEPDIEFSMVYGYWGTSNVADLESSHSQDAGGCLEFHTLPGGTDLQAPAVVQGMQETYNNIVVGLYNKNLKALAGKKCFAKPFLVRYAVELYDGSYTCPSAPIAMFPAITKNCYADFREPEVRVYTFGCLLAFKADFDYSEWSDLVRGVVVFASDGVELYDTTNDQVPLSAYNMSGEGVVIYNSIQKPSVILPHHPSLDERAIKFYELRAGTDHPSVPLFQPLNAKDERSILDDIVSSSVFYKLFEIGLKGSGTWESSKGYINSHVVENPTSQEQLPDDYFSHTTLGGKNIFSYNNRLLISNVRRSFFEGFSSFLPYDNNTSYLYHIYVYIKTPSGERVVCKTLHTYEKMGNYFFYPDPRAYKVDIFFADGRFVAEMELKEHPYLNAAYCFGHLPDGTEDEPTETSGRNEPQQISAKEVLNNQIWTSEVNNPFVFRAEGNINVGSGNIIGLSTLTEALSQGQFGQYPLIIFADEGIWAASTGNTGLFTAVHPMSREVCNNPKSITQTDGAVFFTSKKGLMVVVGNQVKCVSEQMAGRTDAFAVSLYTEANIGHFSTFLENCFIAYDYRDSLLWIFNKGMRHCFVYNIKSGTFGKFDFGTHNEQTSNDLVPNVIDSVVNFYPDYLPQDTQKKVFSLTNRVDINEDENVYTASFLTRPMKLENAFALKTISEVVHAHAIQDNDCLRLRIFASNNLKQNADSWVEIHSLLGNPWKFYRLRYDFSNLRATDRFAGSVLVTQEIRTDKLR